MTQGIADQNQATPEEPSGKCKLIFAPTGLPELSHQVPSTGPSTTTIGILAT